MRREDRFGFGMSLPGVEEDERDIDGPTAAVMVEAEDTDIPDGIKVMDVGEAIKN